MHRIRWSILALLATVTFPSCKPAGVEMRSRSAAPADSRDDSADASITNTQERNVDEGGIVKTHGDHLVILRRGRLFTVKLGEDSLKVSGYVDVTPRPNHDAWYDEMLVHGDTVVVVGYSYRVRSTELAFFHIDDDGELSWTDTYFLASNDYYSSRNYASRLLGDQLIFYMPHHLGGQSDDESPMPRLGRWKGGDRRTRKHGDWERLMQSDERVPSIQGGEATMMHSVITCDLGEPSPACRARGMLGGVARSFYVSSTAVYVWTYDNDYWDWEKVSDGAALYRLPLGPGSFGALHVKGAPVDQFSFKETADGHLNVLLHAGAQGDAMWDPELADAAADVGMLRLPLQAFDRRGDEAPADAYRDLPDLPRRAEPFHNRFVGDRLIYGSGNGWGRPSATSRMPLQVHHYADPAAPTEQLILPHGVDRIEALGADGLVAGTDGENFHFTSLKLGSRTSIAGRHVQLDAAQGELRSHGFFFRETGDGEGMLGLPMRGGGAPGWAHLFHGSARVLYLGVEDLEFSELGALRSDPKAGRRDACFTSCMDWYGNARPIFYRGRVFALMGYELVEGRVEDGTLREVRRVDMSTQIWGSDLRHVG